MTVTSRSNDDLFHALAGRARATSDGRLVLAVIGGLAATLAMALWQPFGWTAIGGFGICWAAFGAWGIADRELTDREPLRSASVVVLRIVRVCSVILGTCAAILAALVMLGSALGTWIS